MKLRSAIIAASLAFACATNAYALTPAYEYTGYTSKTDPRPFTLGFEFSLSSSTSIDALAYFDDGLGNNHDVGIWDTAGNLLASVTVHGTDTLNGHFYYASISTLTLSAGTYVIGGTYLGNNDPFPSNATGVSTVANYTWSADKQLYGTGLQFPTDVFNYYGQNGIPVVNFSVAAVPEPGTYALLCAGLGLMGVVARRRQKRG